MLSLSPFHSTRHCNSLTCRSIVGPSDRRTRHFSSPFLLLHSRYVRQSEREAQERAGRAPERPRVASTAGKVCHPLFLQRYVRTIQTDMSGCKHIFPTIVLIGLLVLHGSKAQYLIIMFTNQMCQFVQDYDRTSEQKRASFSAL